MTDGKDELRARFQNAVGDSDDERDGGNIDDVGDEEDVQETENEENQEDRENVKNYPFYIPEDLRDELDSLYNRYDGLNKVEGGEGIEKHKEFLEPVMRAAIKELDLDEIVPYETDE